MIEGEQVFLGFFVLGFLLHVYFKNWRMKELKKGETLQADLVEYWQGQRRVYGACYLFGLVGLGTLFHGASILWALSLAVAISAILLFATRLR